VPQLARGCQLPAFPASQFAFFEPELCCPPPEPREPMLSFLPCLPLFRVPCLEAILRPGLPRQSPRRHVWPTSSRGQHSSLSLPPAHVLCSAGCTASTPGLEGKEGVCELEFRPRRAWEVLVVKISGDTCWVLSLEGWK
jgi:hypothetical protein